MLKMRFSSHYMQIFFLNQSNALVFIGSTHDKNSSNMTEILIKQLTFKSCISNLLFILVISN